MKKTIALCAIAFAFAAACSNKEQYVRTVDDKPFEATPDRLARGAYLVNNVAVCHLCHSGHVGKELTSPTDPDKFLSGFLIDIPEIATFTAPNLTSSMDGLGGWSDDEIARAIRDGVRNDGSLMFPFMPFYDYKRFSDEDVKAIVVYLRSLPKKDDSYPVVEPELAFPMNIIFGMMNFHSEPAKAVAPVDKSDKLKYGEFLAHVAHCTACHSGAPGKGPGDKEFLSGNPAGEHLPGIGFVAGKNLTPHKEHGIGKYTPDQVKQALREGKRLDGKNMAPPMSMVSGYYGAMTDEDLDALTAYLFSLPPQAVEVPDRVLTPEGEEFVAKGLPPSAVPQGAGAEETPVEEPEAPVEEGEAVPAAEAEAGAAEGDAAPAEGEAPAAEAAPAAEGAADKPAEGAGG
jgi:cytochrome c553